MKGYFSDGNDTFTIRRLLSSPFFWQTSWLRISKLAPTTFCSKMCPHISYYYQKWKEMNIWPKTFYLVALTNYMCLTALALEPLFEILIYDTTKFNPTILTRTLVFIVIIVFQNLHVFFGIFSENIYELYATMVTQFGAFVIIVLRSIFLPKWEIYSMVLLLYGILFQVVYFVYLMPLYRVNSWSFYKKAGADVVMRAKYRNFLLFQVFFEVGLHGFVDKYYGISE